MGFKITAPLGNIYELPALIQAGADELYCGLCFSPGGKKISLNRRSLESHNLGSLEELEAAIDFCHQSAKKLFLVVNKPQYTTEEISHILATIETAAACGIDGVIIADLQLSYKLAELSLPIELHLSTLACAFSRQTLKFWKKRHIQRVILPRQLCTAEIAELASFDLEFEVIVLNGACCFEEGLCSLEHLLSLYSSTLSPGGCNKNFSVETKLFNQQQKAQLSIAEVQRRLHNRFNRNHEKKGPRTCGLCILPSVTSTNLSALKIVGREMPLPDKIRDIRFCRKVINHFLQNSNPEEFYLSAQQEYQKSYQTPCSAGNCYYSNPGIGPRRL